MDIIKNMTHCAGRYRAWRLLTVLVMGIVLPSCSTAPPKVPAVQDVDYPQLAETNRGADTDCSYFYFLWGRTSELDGRFDEALEAYEKAVVCDSGAEYVVRHLAALLLRMNRKQQAMAWVDKLVVADPDDSAIELFQADLYSSMGEFDQAVLHYEKVLSTDKENEEVLVKLGKTYMNKLEYTNARNVFERLVSYDPQSFIGHYYLARLYQALQFFERAKASYIKAMDLNWSVPLALEVGEFYVGQGLNEEAVALYKKVLQEDDFNEVAGGRLVRLYLEIKQPDKALALLNDLRDTTFDTQQVDYTIGRIYLTQKRFPEAIKIIKGILAEDSEAGAARSLLALAYYESGDTEMAKELLLKISAEEEGYDDALFMLVKIYSEEKDFASAIALVRQALTSAEPVQTNYYFLLASLLEEAGQKTEAEKVYLEAIAEFPESTEGHYKYGVFLERNKRLAEAMSQMEEVIALNPQDAYALNYIGYTWADQGVNLEQALDYINQALAIRPDDGFIRDSLGWVYFKSDDLVRAVEELEKAVSIEPDDPTIHEHLGDVYRAAGDTTKALKQYRTSLELSENPEMRSRVQGKIDSME